MKNYSWSPHFWYVLDTIAKRVQPEDDDNEVRTIIMGIGKYLPCKDCKDHFMDYCGRNPVEKSNLRKWLAGLRSEIVKTPKKGCCGKAMVVRPKGEGTLLSLQRLTNS